MGRHSIAKKRRNPSVYVASVCAPAAVLLVGKGDPGPTVEVAEVQPVAQSATAATDTPAAPQTEQPCCVEIVAAPAAVPPAPVTVVEAGAQQPTQASLVSSSRWRVVSRTLPAGVAPERGLQVRTILTARAISAAFPEINNIGGVRQDALRWHPDGLALDVMIPNPGSQNGIALGNQIVAYVMANAERFGIQDAIWRGAYYTPGSGRYGGYGHYDHVHITTTGGGYPSGDEVYYR
ncbi:MAG: hypothetical protein SW019_13780 [Actinomycetota bacterium]|nr:hypothetical protein [Actinomycetota bacterium]